MSRGRMLVSFLTAAPLLVGIVFIIMQTNAFGSGTSTTEDLVTELRDCLKDKEGVVACAPEIVRKMMEKLSAAETMQILGDSFSTRECHVVGHTVGQETYRQVGSVEKAIEACGISCGGACIHGAIGQAFIDKAGTVADSVDLQHLSVDDVRTYGKELCKTVDTCHGVGHILFQLYNEIDAPLSLCAEIAEDIARQSCYTGVFMENGDALSSHNLLLGTRKVLVGDAENLRYPCDAVPKEARHACLRYQPRVQKQIFDEVGIVGKEARQARVRTCESFTDKKDRADCFEGLGFAGYTLIAQDAEEARQYCEQFKLTTDRAACFLGMTFWAANFDEAHESLTMCERVEDEYERNVCYHGVFATMDADGTSQGGLQALCESHDVARCNAGREAYLANPWPTLFGLPL